MINKQKRDERERDYSNIYQNTINIIYWSNLLSSDLDIDQVSHPNRFDLHKVVAYPQCVGRCDPSLYS